MSLTLAATWHPRGEGRRLEALHDVLRSVYEGVAIVVPPALEPGTLPSPEALPGVTVQQAADWSWGRHLALRTALESRATHVQYADMDRLLRWVETRPVEWRAVARRCLEADCLIVGRTEEAYRTHPRALRSTESLTNAVFSRLLGQPVDLSAGIKGFSRPAAEHLIQYSPPGRALGVDAEWPILLQRAGYSIETVWVDGLEWESADRYQDRAVGPDLQQQAAQVYDEDPDNWAYRVQVAREILESGLDALDRPLT
jgi:hypothetical protein